MTVVLWTGQDRLADAQLALERAVHAEASCQQAQAALGFVMNQQQKFNEALTPLKIALALEPSDDSAFMTYHDARTWCRALAWTVC